MLVCGKLESQRRGGRDGCREACNTATGSVMGPTRAPSPGRSAPVAPPHLQPGCNAASAARLRSCRSNTCLPRVARRRQGHQVAPQPLPPHTNHGSEVVRGHAVLHELPHGALLRGRGRRLWVHRRPPSASLLPAAAPSGRAPDHTRPAVRALNTGLQQCLGASRAAGAPSPRPGDGPQGLYIVRQGVCRRRGQGPVLELTTGSSQPVGQTREGRMLFPPALAVTFANPVLQGPSGQVVLCL